MKERLGSPRSLQSKDGLYAVRWKGVTYRAVSPDALLEKLPKRRGEVSSQPTSEPMFGGA